MIESKRRNEKAGFIIKLLIGISTIGIIYLLQYASFSQFSYDSSLFQSAFYSLLMLLFWIGAGWILRKPSHSIKTE
jgi:hypothetical protein